MFLKKRKNEVKVRKHMGKILIVDDDRDIAYLVAEALEDEGFETKVCFDAECAMSYLKENAKETDLITLDIMLPGKSGLEICKAIRGTVSFLRESSFIRAIVKGIKIIRATSFVISIEERKGSITRVTARVFPLFILFKMLFVRTSKIPIDLNPATTAIRHIKMQSTRKSIYSI